MNGSVSGWWMLFWGSPQYLTQCLIHIFGPIIIPFDWLKVGFQDMLVKVNYRTKIKTRLLGLLPLLLYVRNIHSFGLSLGQFRGRPRQIWKRQIGRVSGCQGSRRTNSLSAKNSLSQMSVYTFLNWGLNSLLSLYSWI